jgi:hypothetical protein
MAYPFFVAARGKTKLPWISLCLLRRFRTLRLLNAGRESEQVVIG